MLSDIWDFSAGDFFIKIDKMIFEISEAASLAFIIWKSIQITKKHTPVLPISITEFHKLSISRRGRLFEEIVTVTFQLKREGFIARFHDFSFGHDVNVVRHDVVE